MDFDVGPHQMNYKWISHLGFQNEQNASTNLLSSMIGHDLRLQTFDLHHKLKV
jgi:hypothetical protein